MISRRSPSKVVGRPPMRHLSHPCKGRRSGATERNASEIIGMSERLGEPEFSRLAFPSAAEAAHYFPPLMDGLKAHPFQNQCRTIWVTYYTSDRRTTKL